MSRKNKPARRYAPECIDEASGHDQPKCSTVCRNPTFYLRTGGGKPAFTKRISRCAFRYRNSGKSRGVLCRGVTVRYAWIDVQRLHYAVWRLCRVLQVSRSGYYQWRSWSSTNYLFGIAPNVLNRRFNTLGAIRRGWGVLRILH